jgi:integrase
MSRQLKRLTARTVATLVQVGRHADGGNLYLTISRTADGLSRRWTFLYAINGKQREAGLGSASTVPLKDAREKAAEYRSMLSKGVDPLAVKQATTAAEEARRTFGQCADDLIKSKQSEWRSAKHADQWRKTITGYCGPILGMPVDEVDTAAVLKVLNPIWKRAPESASRLRGRIEAVLNYAKAHKLRVGDNPAAWKGNLADILPRRSKLSRSHYAALPYHAVPEFVCKIREIESIPALTLEFAILTAARSGEVLGARWDEIDLDARIWTIPAVRMKAGIIHRIPLSTRVAEIIEGMARIRCGDHVFPGQRRGQPLGHMALRRLRPAGGTVHGFRSSFRDWCSEETSVSREIAEAALAHVAGDETERAYRRGDALEKRRALMEAWANYCERGAGGNVIALRG